MQSTLVRLAVALLTFGLGVSATMLWIAYRTPDVLRIKRSNHCSFKAHDLPPLPPLPTVEAPPLAPPAPPAPFTRAPISGGLLNNKTLSKPAPLYPQAAVAANASGTVEVRVLVDENGRVISAKAISGHPLLRDAAVDAAYGARFSPTIFEGLPVKVSGSISYNFVLP
ncbi:MAG TPA: energy transducer TonB [Pyrinomonadaceae bacterium]|nr:energy transducer TonB [Pyrinomonadaceae bacterium]